MIKQQYQWSEVESHPLISFGQLALLQEQEETNHLLLSLIAAIEDLRRATVNIYRVQNGKDPF